MSIWMEIHCDRQSPAVDSCGRMACVSGRGDQIGAFAQDNAVAASARKLWARCARGGWVKQKGNAVCPVCAKWWAENPEASS